MILTFVDYIIIVAVFIVMAVRIVADFREIAFSRMVKNAMKATGQKDFMPRLTVIIPFCSQDNVKRVFKEFQNPGGNLAVVVVIDSSEFPREASKLRYFIKKNSIKNTSISSGKNLNLSKIAKKHSTEGMVVVLPETTQVEKSFYTSAILPFSNGNIDALYLSPSVLPGKSLSSGIEALASAWRNYFNMYADNTNNTVLQEGLIVRSEFLRNPTTKIRTVRNQKPIHSIAAQPSARLTWRHLNMSVSFIDYITALFVLAVVALLFQVPSNLLFVVSVFAVLYVLLVWWSLGLVRTSIVDRISVTLLSPLFLLSTSCLVTVQTITFFAVAWGEGFRLLKQSRSASDIRYNI